jgi:hypothetical protein
MVFCLEFLKQGDELMNKLITAALLCVSCAFASDHKEEDGYEWTQTFHLSNGLRVVHLPSFINIGGLTLRSYKSGPNASFNGCVFPNGINLAATMSLADFTENLRQSGVDIVSTE